MKFDDRTFEIMIASDLVRDGMSLEVWETIDGRRAQVAEVFYSDVTGRFAFSAFDECLPLGLVEIMSRMARERLVPAKELVGES